MRSARAARVVLASASPRRRELLALVGIQHEVRPANIDESYLAGETARSHAERLARGKAAAVASRDAVTIGSDTIVVVDGDVLGKPKDARDAAAMLRRLSGRSHVVVTAVAVDWRGRMESAVEEVGVTFRALSDPDIDAYIATGEPMDKAGAYGIQGFGATIVERVDGDYFAVMGLPLNRLVGLLQRLGLRYEFGPVQLPLDQHDGRTPEARPPELDREIRRSDS
jgi:septum formation protein